MLSFTRGKNQLSPSVNRATFILVPKQVGIYNSDDLVPRLLTSSAEEQELLPFLQLTTKRLLMDMEKMGNTIAEIYLTEEIKQRLMLSALTGLCMRSFMEFLFPSGRNDDFYREAVKANQIFLAT